jgi:hypothetical protein
MIRVSVLSVAAQSAPARAQQLAGSPAAGTVLR